MSKSTSGSENPGGLRFHDTQTGMPFGIPKGARCVQRFDDSLNSAIHITYRISLRSSSMWEPRHPSLKVVWYIPSVRGAGRTVSSCEPTDMTTLGGSDWSQSRIRRQIHKWVGVYDRIAPARDDFRSVQTK